MIVDWQPITTAPSNVSVLTKIDDAAGARNEAVLKKLGNLWFFEDGSMYVYYRPTHWRFLSATELAHPDRMTAMRQG